MSISLLWDILALNASDASLSISFLPGLKLAMAVGELEMQGLISMVLGYLKRIGKKKKKKKTQTSQRFHFYYLRKNV